MRRAPLIASGALLIAMSACRPVLAIGWEELLAIVLIVALLLGPLMFRIARTWSKLQEAEKKESRRKS